MKKILNLLFFIHAEYLLSRAQTIKGVPIKDLESEHIPIVGTYKMLYPKLTIDIDFGQPNKAFTTKDTEVRDENDKLVGWRTDSITTVG